MPEPAPAVYWKMAMPGLFGLGLLALVLGLSQPAQAQEFDFKGFGTLAVGAVQSGSRQTQLMGRFDCPCAIADYGHGGLYSKSWSASPESKLGLQSTWKLDPQWSATGQVVVRDVDGLKAGLEWAYLSYSPNSSWTLQAGRKRLPLFYYSDFQDVGYAYNWIRPPQDVYGWEAINFNGFTAAYNTQMGDWSLRGSAFAGREATKDNDAAKIYYDSRQDITWKGIIGADLELANDWLTLRFNLIKNKVDQWDYSSGTREQATRAQAQLIYGVAANIDWQDWLLRSEYSIFDRSDFSYKANGVALAVGYRIGKFTPMLTVGRYRETNRWAPDTVQRDDTLSLSLRYELGRATALKLQWDRFKDKSGPALDFVGNSKLLTLSLDTVF
ncbi:OprO/OprP family phosphate-selective porin [Paucibacter sp. DJ1R-11]|uniref:OprO/OprP family phosphate-selective porin n=1 Tax=Paucibacter sp. DJ1R-11 TaxID=2893556 RepID=UPI0021E3FB73|nr:OprO/OprP family phosphate-selective porin [Paucibacter sp. DJ1R-11]MCV2361858.1 OprO/OprP family phosphate-selective porin [Paucibacter sp. DJ1R-11]